MYFLQSYALLISVSFFLLTSFTVQLTHGLRCLDISCSTNPKFFLQHRPTKNCESCEECTKDGYSICIKDQQSDDRRSKRFAQDGDNNLCVCTTQFPEECEIQTNLASHFSGRVCHESVNKKLPAPSSYLEKTDGVVLTFEKFNDEYEEYWKEFNITSYILHYTFPITGKIKCVKSVVPSIEELSRINADNRRNGETDSQDLQMMCKIKKDLKNIADMELIHNGDITMDEGILDDFAIARNDFGSAGFAKFMFEITFDQPRQIQGNKLIKRRSTIQSETVEIDLNWDQAQDDSVFESEETEEDTEAPTTRTTTTGKAKATKEPPTKVPIATRKQTPPTTTRTSTETVPSSTVHGQHHHPHNHHDHHNTHGPSQGNLGSSQEEAPQTELASAEDDNTTMYLLSGIGVAILILLAVLLCCCRKRCCRDGESTARTTNGQSKNLDGKVYHKAPA